MNRRAFLTTLIAVPLAAKIPFEPKPIPGTWAALERSHFPAFRSNYLYGGSVGGGKSTALTMSMMYHLYTINLRSCGVITNITSDDLGDGFGS